MFWGDIIFCDYFFFISQGLGPILWHFTKYTERLVLLPLDDMQKKKKNLLKPALKWGHLILGSLRVPWWMGEFLIFIKTIVHTVLFVNLDVAAIEPFPERFEHSAQSKVVWLHHEHKKYTSKRNNHLRHFCHNSLICYHFSVHYYYHRTLATLCSCFMSAKTRSSG